MAGGSSYDDGCAKRENMVLAHGGPWLWRDRRPAGAFRKYGQELLQA